MRKWGGGLGYGVVVAKIRALSHTMIGGRQSFEPDGK